MIRFIDLFAGMGGTRIGFEQACKKLNFKNTCVFTSEIKPYAVEIYQHNFNNEEIYGDITQIDANLIPDFDFLLGGFPCQAFSIAGSRKGFDDTRGTLFFDVARILKAKKPKAFILENVEGLVNHDKKNKEDKIGNTLQTILNTLNGLGYHVTWKVLNSNDFGIPQRRKRIYITGCLSGATDLNNFLITQKKLGNILQKNLPCQQTDFRKKLLRLYSEEQLMGKSIKDKRGGENNIHSWDLEIKGPVTTNQKLLMSELLKARRQRKWAEEIGIDWMDGMPLTLDQIYTFEKRHKKCQLKKMLDDLVKKDYMKFEHPKALVKLEGTTLRIKDTSKPKGYNIVAGKLSFELNKILSPNESINTVVATEVNRFGVIDSDGIRNLSDRECLRLFGFPDDYLNCLSQKKLYDLIGNTVVVPVIKNVCLRVLIEYIK
jgi:DNA (cytosine-5)-methyltransferase 1